MMKSRINRESLLENLRSVVGYEFVRTDPVERELFSTDLYSRGPLCEAVVSPHNIDELSKVVALTNTAEYALVPRGGGMTYVGGYRPPHEKTILLDMSLMNRILDINPQDMYIKVEAGVTWKQINEALAPLGLRLPFLGTFSGAVATVGGGLSNGAVFFGSARYGGAADIVLGIEVVTADGSVLKTGQASVAKASSPVCRSYGPDLTGLFVHDSGAFGIKASASLRIMRIPKECGYLSFGFATIGDAVSALSEVARCELTEEAYIMDPVKTRQVLAPDSGGLVADLGALFRIMRQEKKLLRSLVVGGKVALRGRRFVNRGLYSLHIVCAGRSAASVDSDLKQCWSIAKKYKGVMLPDSIPRAARANLFPPLDALLGPTGERWIALNAKVAHSEAMSLLQRADKLLRDYNAAMSELGITSSMLITILSNNCFSFEPVLHWKSAWLPLHRRLPKVGSSEIQEPEDLPAATSLVFEIRERFIQLFQEVGAASNQLGRTYPYFQSLRPENAKFISKLKKHLDPKGVVNPGVLGLTELP